MRIWEWNDSKGEGSITIEKMVDKEREIQWMKKNEKTEWEQWKTCMMLIK